MPLAARVAGHPGIMPGSAGCKGIVHMVQCRPHRARQIEHRARRGWHMACTGMGLTLRQGFTCPAFNHGGIMKSRLKISESRRAVRDGELDMYLMEALEIDNQAQLTDEDWKVINRAEDMEDTW